MGEGGEGGTVPLVNEFYNNSPVIRLSFLSFKIRSSGNRTPWEILTQLLIFCQFLEKKSWKRRKKSSKRRKKISKWRKILQIEEKNSSKRWFIQKEWKIDLNFFHKKNFLRPNSNFWIKFLVFQKNSENKLKIKPNFNLEFLLQGENFFETMPKSGPRDLPGASPGPPRSPYHPQGSTFAFQLRNSAISNSKNFKKIFNHFRNSARKKFQEFSQNSQITLW